MLSVPIPTGDQPINENVDVLASLWSESGRHLERPIDKWSCAVAGCGTIAFVVLKTRQGTRSVCFKHFREINGG